MTAVDAAQSTQSSLSRFTLREERQISDELVKIELRQAFAENRCFDFFPSHDLVKLINAGDGPETLADRYIDIKNAAFGRVSGDDRTILARLGSDARLSSRIVAAVDFVHRAIAADNNLSLLARRFVLVKERHGAPTLHHVSNETTVLAHVGQGPHWTEIPTIYLGLNVFDALAAEEKRGGRDLFDAFRLVLKIEERAIQTGYAHTEVFSPEAARALQSLLDEVIRISAVTEVEPEAAVPERALKGFTERNRQSHLRLLNARVKGDELNFHWDKNLKAIASLERLARRYKKTSDAASLREVMRLLVAASGHDIHEVRNKANMLLERVLAPKEFDAPLATEFVNVHVGETHRFAFSLPDSRGGYFVRIYRNAAAGRIPTQDEIAFDDIELTPDESGAVFIAERRFEEYGHYDYLVYRRKVKNAEWLTLPGASGRINVLPNVAGEIILEIFPDIHGHTGIYWRDPSGHPGLVYNENGEVIRLGRFADIAAHLEDIKERYRITAIYLLGAQRRGTNRSDWAPGATSPSPFSPMSLTEIEPYLGGPEEFRALVARAHALDVKVIVDVVPHLNRMSDVLPDDCAVRCYDGGGALVFRASTDGRYGSWDDGRLFNYRKLAVWDWLADSIVTLIEEYDIDGIRFDSAHAVPIMMKRNNYLFTYDEARSDEDMVEGAIIVNDREDEHFVTTGFYDSACRDILAVPLHYYYMLAVERAVRARGKRFFINIAECYWGHERFLTRLGLIPYNSALFKICENIVHGKTDVREIYHIYDNYFPKSLPRGTELLGILGNHDERRALNTFGHRGLRAAVALTMFMSNIVMDYEGSAEGEGWKVFLDNIYVNWNQFEYAAHRSVEQFYRDWYDFHRTATGKGHLVWANNTMVAAAMKFTATDTWIGVFNFADSNQNASIQFDNPVLPIADDALFKVIDPLYSPITNTYSYFTGRELKTARVNTVVSFTERVKLLRLETVDQLERHYQDFLRDSFFRLCAIGVPAHFTASFAFREITAALHDFDGLANFIISHLLPLFWADHRPTLELGLKRSLYHAFKNGLFDGDTLRGYMNRLAGHEDERLRELGAALLHHSAAGSLVFMSAEAEPFSKSGGLANVVYELPRELVNLEEEVYVITGYYRSGDDKSQRKMREAATKYGVRYAGMNVRFKIMDHDYDVGVHRGEVDGITYFLLDHHEFFDGLYWGYTAEEKLRRRIAFARACAEVICCFNLKPLFTFTNDAYAGIFDGIVRSDHVYNDNPNFRRTTFLHIIHNGGWQYFDAYHRFERGFDLFSLFNLPSWKAGDFSDPVFGDRLNCMAAGIRFADRTITVSPSYARQIEYACDGLERILHNVIGISNAIGRDFRERIDRNFAASGFQEEHYPAFKEHLRTDAKLAATVERDFPEILRGLDAVRAIPDALRRGSTVRTLNKMLLQLQRGFTVDPRAVLFTMIHRITEQKGFQLLLDASEGIFRDLGYQAIIGGAVSSGDQRGEDIAHGLYLLGDYYRDRVSVSFGFQDISIPLLASDIFGMPSMNEPGGISQLEGFACGCLVVARATGGLRDTVFPVRVRDDAIEGNGFLFSDFTPWAFYDAMERAHRFFTANDHLTLQKARVNAERSIYFWDTPARKYIEAIYGIKEIIRVI